MMKLPYGFRNHSTHTKRRNEPMKQFINKKVPMHTQIKVVKTLGGITIGLGVLTVLSMAENAEVIGLSAAAIGAATGVSMVYLGAYGWDHAKASEIRRANRPVTYAAQAMQNIVACEPLQKADGLVIGF